MKEINVAKKQQLYLVEQSCNNESVATQFAITVKEAYEIFDDFCKYPAFPNSRVDLFADVDEVLVVIDTRFSHNGRWAVREDATDEITVVDVVSPETLRRASFGKLKAVTA